MQIKPLTLLLLGFTAHIVSIRVLVPIQLIISREWHPFLVKFGENARNEFWLQIETRNQQINTLETTKTRNTRNGTLLRPSPKP